MNFLQKQIIFVVTVLCLLGSCFSFPTRSSHRARSRENLCGYQSCHQTDPEKINVHLVPHTHDDVGWLKTVDQYYYGARTDIQRAGVQYILDTVTQALQDDSQRRFIYVETAFFWKWWLEQSDSKKEEVKNLVNEGRLEFIGGAWSMNDEATTHYQSTIDQFTWGLRKLNDTFGSCGRPHVGWQIDPFGHTREMASILARMGFDGVFFARLDYQDKSNRMETKTPEMVWEGSPTNLGENADLFTSVLYNHYSAPSGFCFDVLCNTEPFIDNKASPDYNVDQKVQDFVNFVLSQADHYTSKHILITMGDDFHYQDAEMYFKNIDKLIKYVNDVSPDVHVLYSTPSCYLKAVNDAGETYTTKQDDFLPYGSDEHAYWTGYYTSRPSLKYYERLSNNFLQVGKQVEAMTKLGQTGESPLDDLRETMGVMQHHDAITGTEKQHVADDYARMLSTANQGAQESTISAISTLMGSGSENVELLSCMNLNISKCEVTENKDTFVVTVYNPLSKSHSQYIRFPVASGHYAIQDSEGAEVNFQLVPIPQPVLSIPGREQTSASLDLVFRAENLPPLGYHSYYVTRTDSSSVEVQPSEDTFIGSEDTIQLTLDNNSGRVKEVVSGGVTIPLEQNFLYYLGANGDSERASGAYVFRPAYSDPNLVSNTTSFTIYKGELVDEIHQQFSNWVSQVVRVYKQENHAEFEWLVGPLPDDGKFGTEVISTFTSNLATDSVFYTDSNGRELLERKRNWRATWEVSLSEVVSGNYYPITSKILIRDPETGNEVAVLNDRSQGGSSIKDGQIEIMVHRRLKNDDGFGVGEALQENAYDVGLVVRGKHYLVAGNRNRPSPTMAAEERELEQEKLLQPWLFFTPTTLSFTQWQSSYKMEYAGLSRSLPSNVHLLTLEPWKENELLLRLEHIMEKDDDPELSKPVEINLEDLFMSFTIAEIHETTLGGNQWFEEMDRLVWKTGSQTTKEPKHQSRDGPVVTLNPMEILTYIIKVTPK